MLYTTQVIQLIAASCGFLINGLRKVELPPRKIWKALQQLNILSALRKCRHLVQLFNFYSFLPFLPLVFGLGIHLMFLDQFQSVLFSVMNIVRYNVFSFITGRLK